MDRRLADGTVARLTFEYACNRGNMFGEAFFHSVIGEILSSNADQETFKLVPDYRPAVLQVHQRGRKRALDQALVRRDDQSLAVAVEAKWAKTAAGYCTQESILKDLFRLALVTAASPGTEAFFILGGYSHEIDALFQEPFLRPGPSTGAPSKTPAILTRRSPPTGQPRIRETELRHREDIRSALPTKYGAWPISIRTQLVRPLVLSPQRWMSLVWKVLP